MMSNFNLKDGVTFEEFEIAYSQFVKSIETLGLAEGTDAVGKRVRNTPMDTANEDQPEYYAIMHFRDRQQLDASYAHFLGISSEVQEQTFHSEIHRMIEDPIFTCWQDGN